MSEIVFKNAVKREKGYLYFVDAEGSVCRSKMGRKKEEKKENISKEKRGRKTRREKNPEDDFGFNDSDFE